MLKTHHGTLFLSFAGRKTMFRLWSLHWLEKSVDTVDKSMLLQKMFFRNSVIREHIRVCSFRRVQKRIFDPSFAGFRGRKEREIRNWICNLSQTHCSMHDSLSRNDVFSTVCQIMRLYTVQIFWSAVRIATMEHKPVKKEAR